MTTSKFSRVAAAVRASRSGIVGGTAAALAAGMVWSGCQPPSLPCNKDETWKSICAGDLDGGQPKGGGGSATGGGGGMGSGGAGGAGMPDAPPAYPGDNTPVAECPKYPTVGEMDTFFQTRCSSSACHFSQQAFGDYKSPHVWERVATMKTIIACPGTAFADPGGDPSKSVMWFKVQEMPTCADGKPAGARMPQPPAMLLDDAEKKCFQNFIKALKDVPKK
jgi:hypothetical protein